MDSDAVNPTRTTPQSFAVRSGRWLRDVERAVIEQAIELTGNNQSAAARLLGISRPTLLRKLKSYQLETRLPSR